MNILSWARTSLLRSIPIISETSKCFASGRWYPQPERVAGFCTLAPKFSDLTTTNDQIEAVKEKMPVYYTPKGDGKKAYALVESKNGTKIANYVLFEDSINKAAISWNDYNSLSSEERDIYMKHLQAVEERQLSYKDPKTKYSVFTISFHLNKGDCCGNGCRHCPYELKNASEDIKKSKVWNGAFYV